jgi:predicted amidohydrolase
MTTMTVAVAQMSLRVEATLADFLAHVESLVSDAAAGGAELVVLPELASTGLLGSLGHTSTVDTVADDYHHGLTGYTEAIREALSGMAVSHRIVVVGGSHNRTAPDGSLRNTAYVAHPDGRVESQDKIHLTPPEHAMGTQGGDDLLVTRIGPFATGVLICADIQFPELTRALVRRGVELIVCPSLTWNRRGVHRVRTGSQARAMEGQVYVVMSPLVGSSGLPEGAPMHAVGRAFALAPVDRIIGRNDGVLAQVEDDDEQLLFVELDRDLLLASRAAPETPGLALRRDDLYPRLLDTEVDA